MNDLSLEGCRVAAIQLLDRREYCQVISLLKEITHTDSTGESQALMGLAFFHLQKFDRAKECFESALKCNPKNQDWIDLCSMSDVNELLKLNLFGGENQSINPATPSIHELPGIRKSPRIHWFRATGDFAVHGFGKLIALATRVISDSWGWCVGYTGDIWTNWYRRKNFFSILTLVYMRDRLNRKNLNDPYLNKELTGFHAAVQQPPRGATQFRTANGSWNNLANTLEGATGVRFSRNVKNQAVQAELNNKLLKPNPRDLSRRLLTRGDKMQEIPFLNLIAAVWIQFQTHDWASHGENTLNEFIEVPLCEDDPIRKRYQQQNMFVARTQPDPERQAQCEPYPVTHLNEVTHWWDGSQIYGSDEQTLQRLRGHIDGKLKLNANGTLPLAGDGFEDTGFRRNWWVGLSLLHTLFAKEHNVICDRLKSKYPQWDDDRLFNVARLINAAVMAKIHTVEWTPAILPNPIINTVLNANWYGLATNFLRRGKNRKTLSAINIESPEIGGVVGNPIDRHSIAYSLTEEFTEVYRLHSLLPETLLLKQIDSGELTEELPLASTRQAGSPRMTDRFTIPELLYSFGNQHPGKLVLNNYPRFMQEMTVPGNPVMDLAVVDIIRARERGIPRYNEFRYQLGLKRINTFSDLTDDAKQIQALNELYEGDVEVLDLLIGTLAEAQDRRPPGFGFGETLFQIFILNATRRLQADRFYTTDYNETTYTKEGLDWIDDADLKTVLLRHYPELAKTGLANIKNAFEPWDTDEKLDSNRHPLRGFDKTLRSDPWMGDNYKL